jgi:DNA-binding transcriptional LysR family regulator
MYVLYPHGRALAPRVRAFVSFLEEQLKQNAFTKRCAN